MKVKRRYIQLLSFLPAAGIMVLIFLFSSQPADVSDKTSTPFVEALVRAWEKLFGAFEESIRSQRVASMEVTIRKTAHMVEYFLLSISIGIPLSYYHLCCKKLYFTTFLCSVLYAGTDEFHQLFVEGRSGRVSDVVIDSIGIAIGCLLVFLFAHKKLNKTIQ